MDYLDHLGGTATSTTSLLQKYSEVTRYQFLIAKTATKRNRKGERRVVYLKLDWETKSEVDLRTYGIYRYIEGQHTDVLLCAYRFGSDPIKVWRQGEPCPQEIVDHVNSGGLILAHNAAFERLMWKHIAVPKHGWPTPKDDQFHCTASWAAAMSLPRDLYNLGRALNLKQQKDSEGLNLIRRYSIPRKPDVKAGEDPNGIYFHNDKAGLDRFADYAVVDVATESEAASRLVPFSDNEQAIYTLNEIINDRGIRLDVKSAYAAIRLAEASKGRLDAQMAEVTNGAVTACTQVGELVKWVESQGVPLDSAQKADIEEALEEMDDLPDHVRRALELRQLAAKTSVSKISAMLERVSKDGRIRGVYMHQGAGQTGRFSSTGAQVHNMPKPRKVFETEKPNLRNLFKAIRSSSPEWIEMLYGQELGNPMHLLSDSVRGFLWAAPGYEFVNADYSSIEGRKAAWFAGEDWKLEAFRALDRGEGHGIYELAAAGIYGIPVEEVTKAHRPTGKVAELSCQYQTGAGGIRKFARQAKLKLDTLYSNLWASADDERQEYLEKRIEERAKAHDEHLKALGREGWIAAELIKMGWREKHPGIVQAWSLLDEAASNAVSNPGTVFKAVKVAYVVKHGFLWCMLPSGRCLAYGAPKFSDEEAPWADKTLDPEQREKKLTLTVMGVDSQSKSKGWVRHALYGGKLFNNIVQGASRDILCHGMLNAERAGYPIVMHTHDELMAEVPRGTGDVKEFEKLICDLPAWASGLPLTASGWKGKRYRKD